jgi:hypothetical protein
VSDTSTNTRNDTRNSLDSLELLFRVTDFVLVICGAMVVIACITHLAVWGYGVYWAESEKVAKPFTPWAESEKVAKPFTPVTFFPVSKEI